MKKLTQRVAAEQAVLRAARVWWRAKRPLGYTLHEQLVNPTLNCIPIRECVLARAVARLERMKKA